MVRLAFIVTYLGKWPHWMEFFLESVRANDRVHFWLMGAELPKNLNIPSNVFNYLMDVSEVEDCFSKVFDQEIKLHDSHKICDFKCTYGLAYQDILKEYEYWGYCDIDLLFGNLDPILDLLEVKQPDVFSGWGDHQVVGHFTIMKNVDSINKLFFQIDSWESRLRQFSITFPEEGGLSVVLSKNPSIKYLHADNLQLSSDQRWPYLSVSSDYSQSLLTVADRKDWLIRWRPKNLELTLSDGTVVNPLYFHFMGQKPIVYWNSAKHYFDIDRELWFDRNGVANILRRKNAFMFFISIYRATRIWTYKNLRQVASKILPRSIKASLMRPFKKSEK